MVDAKLVVVGGTAQFDQIDLKLPVVIGRGSDVDLALTDELISRRHAEIFEDKGRLLVRDLGSRNGTFVNNCRIQEVSSLEPEQLLTLGTMTFRAIYVPNEALELESLQSTETVRINFNETEPILQPSRAEDLSRVSTVNDLPPQDDIETVDLDEYVKRRDSCELPVEIAARKSEYARMGSEAETPRRAEPLFPVSELLENTAEFLKRRFPK
jgi:pSer/pThr/pTyr-binding forkhead associated (FHA) protein